MRRTVQDVMTREVVAVRGPTPFKELVRLLNEHRVTAVPVLDDAGRLVVGVVSESDLALKEVAAARGPHPRLRDRPAPRRTRQGRQPDRRRAHDGPGGDRRAEELVATAARRMDDRRVKRLPVVDHSGALVGIVTRTDLLKVFLRSDDELRFDVLDHVSGDLLRLPSGTVEVEVGDGVVRLTGRVRAAARRWPWRS